MGTVIEHPHLSEKACLATEEVAATKSEYVAGGRQLRIETSVTREKSRS
jgi:hypothetical protein